MPLPVFIGKITLGEEKLFLTAAACGMNCAKWILEKESLRFIH